MRKLRCIGHTVRKGKNPSKKKDRIEICREPEGERPKQTSKRTFLEEAGKRGKTWNEVKRLAGNGVRGRCFTNIFCF